MDGTTQGALVVARTLLSRRTIIGQDGRGPDNPYALVPLRGGAAELRARDLNPFSSLML